MGAALSRREVRISVLAGVIAALLVVVAGAGLALTTQPKWTAESVLVVLPSADLDTADSAAYYETLSRDRSSPPSPRWPTTSGSRTRPCSNWG